MRRRDFIKVIVGSTFAWPLAASAQKATMPVIGFINSASPEDHAQQLAAFLDGLSETGYVEGRNVSIEYRWAENQYDRLPAMVADLVHRRVAVIVATTTPAALAAKAATTTVPIVFEIGSNPDELDLLGHNNITGIAQLDVAVAPIRLRLLHQFIPPADAMALLVNPASPPLAEANKKGIGAMAKSLELKLHVLNASTERELDAASARAIELRVGGLVIASDSFFVGRQHQLAALALRYSLPAAFARPRVCSSRRLDWLQRQFHRRLSRDRCIRWPSAQWRRASQSAGPARHEGGTVRQPQIRQNSRTQNSRYTKCAR